MGECDCASRTIANYNSHAFFSPLCPTPFSKPINKAYPTRLLPCVCVTEVLSVFTREQGFKVHSVATHIAAGLQLHSKFAHTFVHTLVHTCTVDHNYTNVSIPTDRTSSFSTFDSIELGRYSDDSNRDNEDKVAGKRRPPILFMRCSLIPRPRSTCCMNLV